MYRRNIKAWLISCTIIVMVGSLLSACVKDKPILDELGEDGAGNLRVMYYGEEQFYRQYGSYFAIEHQNIEIEVVDMQSMYAQYRNTTEPMDHEKMTMEFIEQEKPDIILTDITMLEKLADQGKLYNLDPIIQQEKYDLTGVLPGLIDMLREKGKGSLYGLAPSYYTSVMFYNADLFKQHNIEVPRNKMSWKEILELGARFGQIGEGDSQLYGISNQGRTAADLLMEFARTSNLQLIDAQAENVLIDSEGWRDAFNTMVNAINSNAIQTVKRDENGGISYSSNESAFMSGKAAMSMENTWMINQMQHMSQWNPDIKPFDWQMVTMPVDPNYPDESSYVSTNQVYAIHQDAANKRAAWEFLKFINGDKMAKASSKIMNGELPTRVTYLQEVAGKNGEALTMLKPKATQPHLYDAMAKANISFEYYNEVEQGINKAIEELLAGKSSDEVLVPLKQDLQQKLIEAKKNAENAKNEENKDSTVEGTTTETNG